MIKTNADGENNLNEERTVIKQEKEGLSNEDNEKEYQVELTSKKKDIKEEKIEFKEPFPFIKKEESTKPSTSSNIKPSTSSSVAGVFKVPEKRKTSALDDIISVIFFSK